MDEEEEIIVEEPSPSLVVDTQNGATPRRSDLSSSRSGGPRSTRGSPNSRGGHGNSTIKKYTDLSDFNYYFRF